MRRIDGDSLDGKEDKWGYLMDCMNHTIQTATLLKTDPKTHLAILMGLLSLKETITLLREATC